MKKSLINTLLAGAVAATMSTAAHAGSLDSVAGDVKFLFDGFDAAQASYVLDGTTIGTTICSDAASCDAAGATANAPGSNQANDTWGITIVSSIKENAFGGDILWSHGENGDVLLTYFHGFVDIRVDHIDGTKVDVYSNGGMVDIYRVDSAFVSGLDMTDQQSIEDAVGSLTKYLELSFQPGCSLEVAAATLCGTFDTDFASGDSNGFAVATGGTAMAKYANEFHFEQSVAPCNSSCAGTSFTLLVQSGSATTTALPEPASLGLLGLGLVGLGLAGRRRKA